MRLLFLVFHGKTRANHHTFDHAHESPLVMMIPLYVLAIGSIFAGAIGSKVFAMVSAEHNFFAGSIFTQDNNHLLEEIHHAPFLVKSAPVLVGIIATALAYLFYIKRTDLPNKLAKALQPLYKLSFNKWYFDEIYEKVLVAPLKKLSLIFWKIFDNRIIDGLGPNGLAAICKALAGRFSAVQSGYVYHYCLAMILGVLIFLSYLIFSFSNLLKS